MGAFDTLRLPTRRRDWRLIARTVRLVLSIPWYAVLAGLYGMFALSVFVFARNLTILQRVILFGTAPVRARFRILVEMYPGVGTAYTADQTSLLVTTAVLVGVNLALVTYHLREHQVSLRGGSGGAGGVVLGTFGAGCASCGSALLAGVLSLFGASGLLAVLPLDGLEFALLSVVLLVLSIYWIADGLRGGMIRGCPVDIGPE